MGGYPLRECDRIAHTVRLACPGLTGMNRSYRKKTPYLNGDDLGIAHCPGLTGMTHRDVGGSFASPVIEKGACKQPTRQRTG